MILTRKKTNINEHYLFYKESDLMFKDPGES